jgi:hypothetical protein
MKCNYQDSKGHCWYKDHEEITCEFVKREYGCPIARHEAANRHMQQIIEETRVYGRLREQNEDLKEEK